MTRAEPHQQYTSRLRILGVLALLVCVIFIVYLPAIRGGFVWDDDAHVTRPELRSLHGLWLIWSHPGSTQQYYPLLESAFWVQHRLWADEPLGYHVVNILLHAAAACLVYLLLRRLKIPGAHLAAAVFALHPVQVESVAWITELKNTLSALFYLSSAWAYIEFDERRQRRWYAAALGLFVLGLLSKPVTATLPAALLVLFWWKRGRLSWRRDAAPLVPWFGLGAASALFTAWVERALTGAEGAEFSLTTIERCLLAGRAAWFYLGKLLWPSSLIFVYPRWIVNQAIWWQYLPPLGAAGLRVALWLLRGRSRAPLAAMLIFVGTLVPTLGFVNLYLFRYSFVADHFLYLPSLGVIVLAAAGIAVGLARLPVPVRWTGQALAAVLVGVLAVMTWRQSAMYSDAETLYRTTLERNPNCWLAYNNLGNIMTGTDRNPEAVEVLTRAVRLRPDLADIRNNLGNALTQQSRIPEAIEQYGQALKLKPDFAQARNNLGNALAGQGRMAEAIEQYGEALKLKPDDPEAHYNIANALADTGRNDAAIEEYGLALLLKPDYVDAHYNLGNSLLRAGRPAEAIEQYGRVLRLKPDYAEAHNNMGIALTRTGRTEEAIEQFNQALRIKPDFEQARANLRKAQESLAERR